MHSVSWVSRHVVAVTVVLFAVAAMGGVFAFARPTYRPSSPYTLVNMKGQRHYTVAQVRQAFASHALRLARTSRDGNAKHGMTFLSPALKGGHAPDFTATLFGTESTVSFGPNLDPAKGYESRFGNVSVLYGDPHPNQALLARIKAAVSDLQR
jgi:hypothetical protein